MATPSGKTVILGISGSVAAYKAAELARLCVKAGHTVHAVMTEAATHFVGPATFQALTGRAVLTCLWDAPSSQFGLAQDAKGSEDTALGAGMDHIHLSRQADLIVVAPATADTMARLAHGRADDLLSALCLARGACPLMLAPAMNREMWAHPATQRNLRLLQADGVDIIGPDAGDQACGETGFGRMSEPQAIFSAVQAMLAPKPLAGLRVLVTAGPTFEPIDPVRGLTNLSSGKMGYALAQAAREAGADVHLVSGPVCLNAPPGVTRTPVTTAEEMREAVMNEVGRAQIFIAVAAVADYRPAHRAPHKLKKGGAPLTLDLVPNGDILAQVTGLPTPPFCIGFAAETENLAENAERKRRTKRLPLLVANLAQDAMGRDEAELLMLDDRGSHRLPKADKLTQARRVLEHAIDLFNSSKSRQS